MGRSHFRGEMGVTCDDTWYAVPPDWPNRPKGHKSWPAVHATTSPRSSPPGIACLSGHTALTAHATPGPRTKACPHGRSFPLRVICRSPVAVIHASRLASGAICEVVLGYATNRCYRESSASMQRGCKAQYPEAVAVEDSHDCPGVTAHSSMSSYWHEAV
jgi:hypothetical protein